VRAVDVENRSLLSQEWDSVRHGKPAPRSPSKRWLPIDEVD
jgi:hypothetical protein